MDAVIIGPLAMPAGAFTTLLALGAAVLTSLWWQRRGQDIDNTLWLVAITALIGSRLGFILHYPQQFEGTVALLDIRDGGWWWPGTLLAVPVLGWRLWHRAHTRPALLSATAAALITVAISRALLAAVQPAAAPLPAITLYSLEGEPVTLTAQAEGTTLINLWASWCPPCRREMPVLARVKHQFPEVDLLMVNQGEEASAVRHYLANNALEFEHVLLDPDTAIGRHAGTPGLPLTLLFDAQGNELARHFGPLSAASLHHFLSQHLPAGESP